MKTPLIIFDCDGVLVHSEKLTNQVLVNLVRPYGVDMSLDEALRRFTGCKMANCIAQLEELAGRALPEDFVPNVRLGMAEAFKKNLQAIRGVEDALKEITYTKCVASSGPLEKINLSLSLTGLKRFFGNHIFSSYVVKIWKPDPGFYLHAAKVMGYAPENCIVVEDSGFGVEAGVAAGMKVFGYSENGDSQGLKD